MTPTADTSWAGDDTQTELEGPELTTIATASLAKWHRTCDARRLDKHGSTIGVTASLPVSE